MTLPSGHCQHQVAQVGGAIATSSDVEILAKAFYAKVADFNIRGGFDQINHPGYLTEFSFCPQCGEKLTPDINRDGLLLEALEQYDCKGRPALEIKKAEEIKTLKGPLNKQSINDSLRLYFLITREASFYKDHPNYQPCGICYTSNSGERVTLVGNDAYDCIDKAMLNELQIARAA